MKGRDNRLKMGLKYFRRVLGAIVGGAMLLSFIDILDLAPNAIHGLAHIQIVPAIMAGSVVILVVMSLLTLILGRVYCSVVCPLGILQDFIWRLKKWYLRLVKKQKNLRVKYKKPLNALRYGVLILVAAPFIFAITLPITLLDPYSNFGRIAVSLVRPIIVWVNNMIATLLNSMGNYSIYNVPELGFSVVTLFSLAILIVLVVMVWRRGRLWCNTMCPVGTALGLISRFSLFRVSLDQTHCNSCGVCASACKSHCIDPKTRTVDASRCITCFDCLGRCKDDGVTYRPSGWTFLCKKSARQEVQKVTVVEGNESNRDDQSCVIDDGLRIDQLARRRFLKGSLLALAAIPASSAIAQSLTGGSKDKIQAKKRSPMPPGAVDQERFRSKCTACQLCVTSCPTHVLKPAFMENGLTGMMQPYMKFQTECFCNYECKVCTEVCPNGALLPLTLEQKKLTRVGMAIFDKTRCKVYEYNVDCGACAEHCPSQAVHMIPYKDGLTIPKVNAKLCIGCGGCESICPIMPPAIHVNGVTKQSVADAPVADTFEAGVVDDFGF